MKILRSDFVDDTVGTSTIGRVFIAVIIIIFISFISISILTTSTIDIDEMINPTPEVNWTFNQQNDELEVSHNGGDSVDGSKLTIVSTDSIFDTNNSTNNIGIYGEEIVEYGDSEIVSVDNQERDDGTIVWIIWSEGVRSEVIGKYNLST